LRTAKLDGCEQTIHANQGLFFSNACSPNEPPTPIRHTYFKGGI